MRNSSLYEFDISGMKKMLESISPALKSIQLYKNVESSVRVAEQYQRMLGTIDIVGLEKSLTRATDQYRQMLGAIDMVGLQRSIAKASELSIATSLLAESRNLQKILNPVALESIYNLERTYISVFQNNLSGIVQQLNSGFASSMLKTMQHLYTDTSAIERTIQSNLRALGTAFDAVDWSSVADSEEFEEFAEEYEKFTEEIEELNIENPPESVVIDLGDRVSLLKRAIEFIKQFSTKHPVFTAIILVFVLNPMQDAINDRMRYLADRAKTTVIEQFQTNDHRVVEKNIRAKVNDTLVVNVESKVIRDRFKRNYGFVSTDKLVVRQGNKVNSRVLCILDYGQIVKIVRKNKNWTLLEYESDTENIQGWVFTRYIKRFNK